MTDNQYTSGEGYVLCRRRKGNPKFRRYNSYDEAYGVMLSEFCESSGLEAENMAEFQTLPYYDVCGIINECYADNAVLDIEWLICKPDEVGRVKGGYILGGEEHLIPRSKSQVINGIIASMTVTNSQYHSDKTGNYYTAQLIIPDKESLILIYDEDDDRLTIGNWYVLGELLIKAIYDKIVSAIIETAA